MNIAVIGIRPKPAPRPRVYRNRTIMPKQYEEFKEIVANKCKNFSLMRGEVRATLYFHFKEAKSSKKNKYPMPIGDCDNLAKSVLDAIEGIAYENDRQVTELIVKKGYSSENLIEIKLEGL